MKKSFTKPSDPAKRKQLSLGSFERESLTLSSSGLVYSQGGKTDLSSEPFSLYGYRRKSHKLKEETPFRYDFNLLRSQ